MSETLTVSGRVSPAARPVNRAFAISLTLLLAAVFLSLLLGPRPVGLADIWHAVTGFDPDNAEQIVIRDIRWPKTLGGLLVGAALGTAGAVIQAVTRNPLADPGLLGVNAGATAGVVLPIFLLGLVDPSAYIWPALGGAMAASLLVWGLGAAGTGVVGMLVAGAAVTAFLFSLVGALLLLSRSALDVYRHWVLGALEGISLEAIQALLPFFLVGFACTALAARFLNALALGNDLARTLGTHIWLTRGLSLLAITCLCAASVALAGPIGFIGLLVPHAARRFSGADMRATIALSAIFGASLLLVADTAGRIILPGIRIDAGLTIALIGGPLMVVLISRGRVLSL